MFVCCAADQRAVVRVVPVELGVQLGQTVTLSCVTFGGSPPPKEAQWNGPDGFSRKADLHSIRLDDNYVAPYEDAGTPLSDEFGSILYRKKNLVDTVAVLVSSDAKFGDYSCTVESLARFGKSVNVGRLLQRVQKRAAPDELSPERSTTAKPTGALGTPRMSFEFGVDVFNGTDEPLFSATARRTFVLRCVVTGARCLCLCLWPPLVLCSALC